MTETLPFVVGDVLPDSVKVTFDLLRRGEELSIAQALVRFVFCVGDVLLLPLRLHNLKSFSLSRATPPPTVSTQFFVYKSSSKEETVSCTLAPH